MGNCSSASTEGGDEEQQPLAASSPVREQEAAPYGRASSPIGSGSKKPPVPCEQPASPVGQREPAPYGYTPSPTRSANKPSIPREHAPSSPEPPVREREPAPYGYTPSSPTRSANKPSIPREHAPSSPVGQREPAPYGYTPSPTRSANTPSVPREHAPSLPAGKREPAPYGYTPSSPTRSAKEPVPSHRSPPASPVRTRERVGPSPKRATKPPPTQGSQNKQAPDHVDPSKWKLTEMQFAGSASYDEVGREEEVKGIPIKQGIKKFKAHPDKYVAMHYQTSMLDWPEEQQAFTYLHRAGTKAYKPQGLSKTGWMTVLLNTYQRLPPLKNNVLPARHCDKYTDNMSHGRIKLHSKNNKPILPGRGMGFEDTPSLKIIGDVDPSDIHQGTVGDCWLLSGISSLAEFDGAVKRLFRKTKNLDTMPRNGPNKYTVTLWDLTTWKEVDIVVDERLCVMADGSGQLLAAKPSEDGELWVCYLEKALAAHCGGWDKITGGQCTHAWSLLTGCKHQYTISKNKKTGKFACYAKYDPNIQEWAKHGNSPHDGGKSVWRVAWPEVGSGGGVDKELDEEELFTQLCAWDDVNYIVGASTSGSSDKHHTGGMVDNHAYSVIESVNDVAGTDIDLIKVRNPWGKGEIEDGEFDDDGPGWDRYPQIKAALNPVVADDGIFWVTKQEFFEIFDTVYLSASNMTAFLED